MDKIKKIYCDFDGTITKQDTVNTFFEKFAHQDWLVYEKQWIEGKITSRENAVKQLELLREISQKELEDFINSIELDDYFLKFLDFTRKCGIEVIILSDGFDLFIQKVLARFGISDLKFYANNLVYKDNKFSIEFPHYNIDCDKGAGMCKCAKITDKNFCYVGDGTSDLCVARKAKILFATKSLCKYCEVNNIRHAKFESFSDIIDTISYINEVFYGNFNAK